MWLTSEPREAIASLSPHYGLVRLLTYDVDAAHNDDDQLMHSSVGPSRAGNRAFCRANFWGLQADRAYSLFCSERRSPLQ